MKVKMKRLLSVVMIMAIILSLLPNHVYATEMESTESTTEVTTELSTIDNSESSEEVTEVSTEVTTESEIESTEATTELSTVDNATEETTVKANKIAGGFKINGFMAYGNLSETEDYTLKPLTDNALLKKVMYYSYGCVGYTETIPITYSESSESTKVSIANAIVTNVLNGTSDSVSAKFLNDIKTLPAPGSSVITPYYVMNAYEEKVGVTFTSNQPIPQAKTIEDGVVIGGDDVELLGAVHTTAGTDGGWLSRSSFDYVSNPGTYGLPITPTTIANYMNYNGGYHYYSYSYNGSYSNSGSFYTRYANVNMDGHTIQIALKNCVSGPSHDAPSSSDDTADMTQTANGSNNLHYPNVGHVTGSTGNGSHPLIQAYIDSYDTTNHRVYIRFLTPHIAYNNNGTCVQAADGGIWYDYQSDEYITVTKDDFADYLSAMKNADANLSSLTTDGITFGIYKSDKSTLVCKYFIDATGQGLLMNDAGQITPATVKPLPAGEKYYIKELSGNASYKVDSTGGDGNGFYEFSPHNTSSSSPQQIVRVDDIATYVLNLKKVSANPNCTNGNPLYSLAGAEYVLRDKNGTSANFIVGYETNSNYQDSNGKSTNQVLHIPIFKNTGSAKLITDANGNFTYTFTYDGDSSNITNYYQNVKVNGNQYTITFTNGIQVVAGTYRLSETKAPRGYDFDEDCALKWGKYHEVTLGTGHQTATITCKEPPHSDPLQYSMTKMDSTYGEVATGKGSLDGSIFEVAYYNNYYTKDNLPSNPTAKWYFKTVNGAWEFRNSPLFNGDGFVSSEVYKDTNGQRTIPMGTVTIKEVKAPDGYALVNDNTLTGKYVIDGNDYNDTGCILYQFKWNDTLGMVEPYLDGTTVSSGSIQEIKTSTYDTIKRGDIEFDKIDFKSGKKMKHIGFLIKSKTTGEQHIIVTDENGHASSRTPAHSENTNGNDKYIDDLENDAVLTNQLHPTGIWFYGTADKDKWDASLIDDSVGAFPYDDYDIKEIVSDGNAGTQLINWGDYTFSIVNNGDIDSQTLIDMDLPHFETDSADKKLNNNYTVAEKGAEITDTISYEKLRFDHTYTFKGIMVAREDFVTDNGVTYKAGQPLLDDNGNYIRSNTSFDTSSRDGSNYTANASGTVKLNYQFDAESLSGAKGVWQVYLCDGADDNLLVLDDNGVVDKAASGVLSNRLNNGDKYWYEDIRLNNQREWITFPSVTLHTTALSEDTQTHEGRVYKEAKVIDTVEYTNLLPERTYKLVATAIDKSSGKAIEIDGKPLVVEKEFKTPNAPKNEYCLIDGYEDVTFTFDSTILAGKTMVVFEKLYIQSGLTDWRYISNHEDINDEGQSVHFVDVHTTALDKKTGTHEVAATKKVTVVDKVAYTNLIVGRKYTVKGLLMLIPDEVGDADNVDSLDKDKFDYTLHDYPYTYDAERDIYIDANGIECHPLIINGEKVTGETTFIAEQPNGTVDVSFTFDARSLKGRDIVAFEDIYNEGGIRIGSHADIFDDDQTITVVPKNTSIVISTRTKIGGAGGVRTGDSIFMVAIMLILSLMGFIMLYYKKHKKRFAINKKQKLMLIAMLLGTGACGMYCHASNDSDVLKNVKFDGKTYDYVVTKEFESDSKDGTCDFDKSYSGKKLSITQFDVKDTIYTYKVSTTSKSFKNLDKKDDDKIPETIDKDGKTYQLKDVTWVEEPQKEDVEYTIDYGYLTNEPNPPETYDYTYTSPVTKKEVTVTLPFIRLDKSEPAWVDGFSGNVTFKNLDGEEFTLGNHKFDYEDNLSLTESDYSELVKLLGYDTSLYRFNNFRWDGAAYETSDGEIWRNAVVTGQQFASKYSAYYADTVDGAVKYTAKATYECQEVDENVEPTYLIVGKGYYKSNRVRNVVFGILMFAIFVVLAIYVLTRKEKRKRSYSPKGIDNKL